MKVLIADDHPIVRTSMRHVLGALESNVEIMEAESFSGAAAAIAVNDDFDQE